MPLFQQTVVTKYLNTQDTATLQSRWQIFQEHFHNPAIQENIRNSKEEQYQGEFLIDLFVNVLGIHQKPDPRFQFNHGIQKRKGQQKGGRRHHI